MGSSNSRKRKIPNRFKELVKQKGITPTEFQEKTERAAQTFDGYMKGDPIPIEVALVLANEYGVSLDWFYMRNTFFSELDTMVSVLFALDKVFRIRKVRRTTPQKDSSAYEYTEMALFIDERFHNFIVDIQELEKLDSASDIFSDKDYQNKREEIYSKHREYLKTIFTVDSFNEEKAIQIQDFEGINIINLFANAIKR